MMSDRRLDLAEALLAKARSTSFDGERESFVAGAYTQLGEFLGTGRLAGLGGRQLPASPTPPAGALPSGAAPAGHDCACEVDDDGSGEEVAGDELISAGRPPVIDLAAAERAYRYAGGPVRSGVLVDLTI